MWLKFCTESQHCFPTSWSGYHVLTSSVQILQSNSSILFSRCQHCQHQKFPKAAAHDDTCNTQMHTEYCWPQSSAGCLNSWNAELRTGQFFMADPNPELMSQSLSNCPLPQSSKRNPSAELEKSSPTGWAFKLGPRILEHIHIIHIIHIYPHISTYIHIYHISTSSRIS